MTTPTQHLAVLRTALDAEEQLFTHTASLPGLHRRRGVR